MTLALQLMQQKFKKIVELLFPAQCLLCHLPSNDKLICDHCQKEFNQARSCCLHCGLSLHTTQPYCGDCLKHPHHFTQLYALADYQTPFSTLIKQLKYKKNLLAGELLGQLLCQALITHLDYNKIQQIDYLLAVPLHPKKVRQRGFNQTQIITQYLSKQLNIPLLSEGIERSKETRPQEGLSRHKRNSNLKGAFTINTVQQKALNNSYIVIIDDVVTTGATVNSLSQLLVQAGVKRIDIWCVCRTASVN